MTFDTEPGPLASIPFFETELALITADGPQAEMPIDGGLVPVAELLAHLRALAPRAVAVVPVDPMPRDQAAYDRAHGAILAVLTLLEIPIEETRTVARRTWH